MLMVALASIVEEYSEQIRLANMARDCESGRRRS